MLAVCAAWRVWPYECNHLTAAARFHLAACTGSGPWNLGSCASRFVPPETRIGTIEFLPNSICGACDQLPMLACASWTVAHNTPHTPLCSSPAVGSSIPSDPSNTACMLTPKHSSVSSVHTDLTRPPPPRCECVLVCAPRAPCDLCDPVLQSGTSKTTPPSSAPSRRCCRCCERAPRPPSS